MSNQLNNQLNNQRRAYLSAQFSAFPTTDGLQLPGRPEREYMTAEDGTKERNMQMPVPRDVFNAFPEDVKPLFRHWVEGMS